VPDRAASAPRAQQDPAAARAAARGCRVCTLWRNATQTVFGEGPAPAAFLLVGEQPGDREDLAGHPFVGPEGKLLEHALADAGIAREDAYLTNVVKHFKWHPGGAGGKRRIHDRPNRSEVDACLPWLRAELEGVAPRVLVLLGATAAQALLGPGPRVTRSRGKTLDSDLAPTVVATAHPSAVLRAGDRRDAEYAALVEDLRFARDAAG
jgi:DNA polymerase